MTSLRTPSSAPISPTRTERGLRVAVVGVIAAGAVIALRLAGAQQAVPQLGADWMTWARSTDPVDAVLPLAIAALALAVGVALIFTVLYCGLRACGCARLAARIGWMVMPQLRARIDRAIAVGVVASVFLVGTAGQAAYAEDTASVVRQPEATTVVVEPAPAPADVVREPEVAAPVVEPGPDVPIARDDATAPEATSPTPADGVHTGRAEDGAGAPGAPSVDDVLDLQDQIRGEVGPDSGAGSTGAQPVAPSAAGGAPEVAGTSAGARDAQSYTVLEGDNLWAVAARHLAQVRGVGEGSLATSDVAAYWVQVVEQNRPALRSGNPSLIYAGEVIALPAAS